MITALLQHEIREENMGEISFSNHISNKKSAINSKAKLAGVAKHNLRKYHSQDYQDKRMNKQIVNITSFC